MYIDYMKWSIANARKRFSELLSSAVEEPQAIYNRDRLVGAVVDPETLAEFQAWRAKRKGASLGKAFAELRRISAEERYEPVWPERRNRENPFVNALDELSD